MFAFAVAHAADTALDKAESSARTMFAFALEAWRSRAAAAVVVADVDTSFAVAAFPRLRTGYNKVNIKYSRSETDWS
jgi:hypothetical protein